MEPQRDIRSAVLNPLQQRRLEYQVFNQASRNLKVIVWFSKPAFGFQDRSGRKVAFFQPRVANRRNRRIEEMVQVMECMECKNIPSGNFGSADHALPNGY